MSSLWKSLRTVKVLCRLTCIVVLVLFLIAGLAFHEATASPAAIVLDGVDGVGEWDAAWQVALDGLDVLLTDTGLHPHDAPTYARSGYDALGLWAHYDVASSTWFFRLDVDGRAADSDSQVGTSSNFGVGTHDTDQGPLVDPPYVDGQGLGNSEEYTLGFQYASAVPGFTASFGPGTTILPGIVAPTTSGASGVAVYGTTVPGIVEWAFDQDVIIPSGSAHAELWVSAQLGDHNDRVSDDQIPSTLVTAVDVAAQCPAASIVAGEEATLSLAYAIPAAASQGVNNAMLNVALPAGTTFVSATGGGTESGGVVTWNLGNLSPGDAGQVYVTLRLDDSLTALPISGEIAVAEGLRDTSSVQCSVQQPAPQPPAVPEASTLVLVSSALSALVGYAGLQLRKRRRASAN